MNVRVPIELERAVIAFADDGELGFSEAVRVLLERGLDAGRPTYLTPRMRELAATGDAVGRPIDFSPEAIADGAPEAVGRSLGLSKRERDRMVEAVTEHGARVMATPEELAAVGFPSSVEA